MVLLGPRPRRRCAARGDSSGAAASSVQRPEVDDPAHAAPRGRRRRTAAVLILPAPGGDAPDLDLDLDPRQPGPERDFDVLGPVGPVGGGAEDVDALLQREDLAPGPLGVPPGLEAAPERAPCGGGPRLQAVNVLGDDDGRPEDLGQAEEDLDVVRGGLLDATRAALWVENSCNRHFFKKKWEMFNMTQ